MCFSNHWHTCLVIVFGDLLRISFILRRSILNYFAFSGWFSVLYCLFALSVDFVYSSALHLGVSCLHAVCFICWYPLALLISIVRSGIELHLSPCWLYGPQSIRYRKLHGTRACVARSNLASVVFPQSCASNRGSRWGSLDRDARKDLKPRLLL